MRSFLISDNSETLVGMRLAGVGGILLDDRESIVSKIDELIADPEVGIIMVTGGVMKKAEEEIMERKMRESRTLIVQIPGTHDETDEDRISRYIRESIGLKF